MKLSKVEKGILGVVAFVLIGAFQEVYVGHLVQTHHPLWVMTFTFLVAALFFAGISRKNSDLNLESISKNSTLILFLNMTTALSWFGFMISLKYLEPAIVSCICFALGPILVTFFNPIFNREEKINKQEIFASVGMLFGVSLLSYFAVSGNTALNTYSSKQTLYGLIGAFTSAIGIMGNTFLSKKMTSKGFVSTSVMALRFPILIIAGASTIGVASVPLELSTNFIVTMVFLSVFTVIIPLYLLQVGIEKIEPITVSLLVSSMPIITFFLQMFDARLSPSLYSLIGVCICFVAAIGGVLARYGKLQLFSSQATCDIK